jgi:hypothetical protein
MAQHDQLDVLDLRGAAATDQQLQQVREDEVDKGEEHRAMLPEPAGAGAQVKPGFWHLQLRAAVRRFAHTYSREWLLERHGYRTPVEAREQLLSEALMA